MSEAAALHALIGSASACYRPTGRFALHFARHKLRLDPAYRTILAQGLLQGRARLLDLGCGQGLLGSWLMAARLRYSQDGLSWPSGWPAPPLIESYRGIDINAHEVARARRALAPHTATALTIEHADICSADYPRADAIVILDVLHYLDLTSQEAVLRRARAALSERGLLLLRIGDAAGGLGHRFGMAVDHTVALLRRGRGIELACRALSDWEQLLEHCGFATRTVPLAGSGGFVNVLLQAQAA
jgi:SAM-dependent methyltransferase